jgi:two-component system OmpR family response regulator
MPRHSRACHVRTCAKSAKECAKPPQHHPRAPLIGCVSLSMRSAQFTPGYPHSHTHRGLAQSTRDGDASASLRPTAEPGVVALDPITEISDSRSPKAEIMTTQPLVLIADDDPHIREVIRFALSREGMRVIEAADGAEAIAAFAEHNPDLVVLDVGMPEADGLDVCREIRKTHETPVLFLSARDEEIDRILGLEIGGDDYVGKPFSPRELTARAKAILKRAGAAATPVDDAPLSHGALTLDDAIHEAHFAEAPLRLTPLEFGILRTFLKRSDRVVRRDEIASSAYEMNVHVSSRTIDSHIRNIRVKLSELGCGSSIETVHGVGFRLGACQPAAQQPAIQQPA